MYYPVWMFKLLQVMFKVFQMFQVFITFLQLFQFLGFVSKSSRYYRCSSVQGILVVLSIPDVKGVPHSLGTIGVSKCPRYIIWVF
jgi:hypothetical protein